MPLCDPDGFDIGRSGQDQGAAGRQHALINGQEAVLRQPGLRYQHFTTPQTADARPPNAAWGLAAPMGPAPQAALVCVFSAG